MKNYTMGLMMRMYADVLHGKNEQCLATFSDLSEDITGNKSIAFLNKGRFVEEYDWFSEEFANLIEKHGVNMPDNEYFAVLLPINLQEALTVSASHTNASDDVLSVSLKDGTECLLGHDILVVPKFKLYALKEMILAASSSYTLLYCDENDNMTPSMDEADSAYFGVWTTCPPLYWSNMLARFMHYWLNHVDGAGQEVLYTTENATYQLDKNGITSQTEDGTSVRWSAPMKVCKSKWELAADLMPDVVTLELPESCINYYFTLHTTVNKDMSWFRCGKHTCIVFGGCFIVADKFLVKHLLNIVKVPIDVYTTCVKADNKYEKANRETATYWFLAAPRSLEDDADVSNLKDAIASNEYGKLYRALCAIDKELPAKLDVILKSL